MNMLRQYYAFQKTDRDFCDLALKKQPIVLNLQILDEKRRSIQSEIFSLSSISDKCSTCQVSCCNGNYNHFTIIDFFLRLFSNKPIKEYEEIQKKQLPLLKILLDITKRPKLVSVAYESVLGSKCPELTPNGCSLSPEDRPIRCILFTCKIFRRSLPRGNLERIGLLTKELWSISSQVFKTFSRWLMQEIKHILSSISV